MSIYSKINKAILLPIADKLTGRGIRKEWDLMSQMDLVSEEELIALQNQRLQALVRHCYENVPYYTRLFDSLNLKPSDIQSRQDLQKLPILTKQMVRDNYAKLISKDIHTRNHQNGSTGGSTGTPLQFKKDVGTWNMAWASSFRAWEWYGYHLGEKMMTLGGNSLVKKRKILTPKDVFDIVIMRNMKRSSADVTNEALQKHYEAFMRYKPVALRGYATAFFVLAQYIEKNNLPIHPIKLVLTTGEILMPEYRATIERVFQCDVCDEYGAGDGGVNAHECTQKNGLHISEERCVVEITDKNGNVLKDGEIGFVTTTDLGNYAFPFLRYQVGDMAYIKPEKCQCGRASRVLGQVIGRVGKLIYNKKGVPVSSIIIDNMMFINCDYHTQEHYEIYNRIDKFQIRQDKFGDISILIKPKNPNEDPHLFDYCIDNFANHFVDSKIELRYVDDIPVMPSGKMDYCVSEYELFR